jgi:hypothetical protein
VPVDKLNVPLYAFVPDSELDFLTGSHVKLDTDCIDTDCKDIDCTNTNCINTDCIDTKFNTFKLHGHRLYNTNLYCSNSHDMNLYRVPDSHVKLNILDDMQECLNNSHHRIAFEYDEDTLSLRPPRPMLESGGEDHGLPHGCH